MKYVDMNNRWSYKGSLTTPPCSKTVFFNVMRTVWPIKQRHLSALHNLMTSHGNGAFFSRADGNHRVIQPVDTQNPVIIVNTNPTGLGAAASQFRTLFIVFVVLFGVAMILCCITCIMYMRKDPLATVG